jgi:hypothetical protein
MALRKRPCLWNCNNPKCDPVRCFGIIVYDKNDPRAWLGRGFEAVPGKPLGWAWHMELEAIRNHLRRRIWKFGLDGFARFRLDQRAQEIQRRLHRWNRPTMRERQAIWKAKQPPRTTANVTFTLEELQHLTDLFEGANDPLSASIGEKAKAALDTDRKPI